MNKVPSVLTASICGGLGNQLFQVANLVATAARHELPMALERQEWSDSIDQPRPCYWGTVFSRFCEVCPPLSLPDTRYPYRLVTVGEQRPLGASKVQLFPESLSGQSLITLVGFFQSSNYFNDFEELVKELLVDPGLAAAARAMVERAYGGGDSTATYVALHMRRGDYLKYADTFETLPLDYYDAALRLLVGPFLGKVSNGRKLKVLIFSDDITFARGASDYFMSKYVGIDVCVVRPETEQAAGVLLASYVPTPLDVPDNLDVTAVPLPRDVLELYMMMACDDVVIANSTFSWWGAYLGNSDLGRVVAPSKWFVNEPYPQSSHLYNKGWIVI